MKPLYFISDIHLGSGEAGEQKRRERRFIDFLEHVGQTGEALIIAGDLFDFWFEYRSVMPRRHLETLLALRRLVQSGVAVTLLAGNHDFWAGDFFSRDMGIPVYMDGYTFEREGRRYYVGHGDGLAKADKGYRVLKRVLRNPLNNRLFGLLHPDLGFALADACSRLSRRHRPFDVDDSDYDDFARQKLHEGYNGVVLGHTHRPRRWEEDEGTYVNLGDWIDHDTYGRLEGGRLTLERWPANPNTSDDKTP